MSAHQSCLVSEIPETSLGAYGNDTGGTLITVMGTMSYSYGRLDDKCTTRPLIFLELVCSHRQRRSKGRAKPKAQTE